MQAASREALATAREQLEEIVREAGADALRTLGEELFAVLGVLSAERVLRRHLSDQSTEESARRRLVDTVFGGKVSQPTQRLLGTVAASRWSASTDLLDGLEVLAREATLAQAERDGKIEDVEDELFRFGRILDSQPRLTELLTDDAAPAARRTELLDGLVGTKVHPVTKQLLDALVRLPRTRSLEVAVDKLAELAAARRNRSVAHVTAAAPLSGPQERRLAEVLAHIFGRPVSVQVELDPSVLGGLVIRVGDEVVDGSIVARLDRARQELPG
jgi:F-type H+-transporting ATPase subunit delta